MFRFPMEKIGLLAEKWRSRPEINIVDYPLITKESLYCVHDPKYVEGIFNGTIQNGFGTTDPSIAEIELYQVSSFLEASKDALINGVSCSPTAGFHHANYNFSGKFCVFNGFMYAAFYLKNQNLAKKNWNLGS